MSSQSSVVSCQSLAQVVEMRMKGVRKGFCGLRRKQAALAGGATASAGYKVR